MRMAVGLRECGARSNPYIAKGCRGSTDMSMEAEGRECEWLHCCRLIMAKQAVDLVKYRT